VHLLSVFSLRNRALIALVTIVVGVFGSIALTSLKQELIPSLTFPQLVVVTSYPGAAPEVVDQYVSGPIETAIQGVEGLESTTATSSTNRSSVSASFAYGTDLISAEQKVERAINRIKSALPADVDPQVITGSIDDLPVVQIAATSDLDARDLTAAIQGSTLTDIQSLKDVRQASLLGTTAQRVSITPDAAKLAAAGLTSQAIRDALNANGALLPAGSITEGDKTLSVQAGSRLGSAEDIAALPLVRGASLAGPAAGLQPGAPLAGNGAATPLTIADVATVAIVDSPITGISRVNGEPALTIAVTKTPAGNTVAVSKEVRALVPDLQKALGHNTQLTVVFDQAPFIQQ
jgi:HAE1 family hydrophobic/amphiphilic exporter-1